MNSIKIVTSNKERFLSFAKTIAQFNLIAEQIKLNLDEIQSNNLEEIAIRKGLDAAKKIGEPCVVEDTEFRIDALNGFPGPFMRYAQEQLNEEKLLSLMKNEKNRQCVSRNILVYAEPNGFTKSFECKVEFEILEKGRGEYLRKNWDRLLMLKETHKTLAEYKPPEPINQWNKGYTEFGKWYSNKS
ncbi:MAG: non-canonical purine NTP pyrophosphatase [archaeon]